jgi:glycerophosphoryl diester phosphodiesterase
MLIIGHRGYPIKYPENTIASFLGALLHGADGVELDVWLTSDGEVVIIHDRDTSRVLGVSLDVKKTSYDELRKYSLGMGQHIPLLSDVLKAIPDKYLLFVEIKDVDAAGKTYEIVSSSNRLEDTVFISFNAEALRIIRSIDPGVKLGFNIGSLEDALKAFKLYKELKLYSINPPIGGLKIIGTEEFKKYLVKARSIGAKTVVWTVDDPLMISGFSELVDAVITNNVEAFTS